jgi:acyl carrier protein
MEDRLQAIFRSVFEDGQLVITGNTSARDIPRWDSLTHIRLIAEVEEEFGVRFSFNEVMAFNTVEDLVNSLRQHLKTDR